MPLSVAVFVCPVELRLRPVGTVPLVVNVQAPPLATVSTCEYGVPAVPAGKDEGVKLRFALAILTEYACEAGPFAQLALTVKLKVPAGDGVPLKVAVFVSPVELRLRPVGTAPLVVNLQAPPFGTVSTCEYGVPAVPAGSDEGLKLRTALAILTE